MTDPAAVGSTGSTGTADAAGATRLVLLADTHLPKRAKALPDELWAAIEAADLVVHAGDWVQVELLDELQDRSAALLACWGNNDGPDLRARLPEVGHAVVSGLRLGVVHETGARTGREARSAAAHPDLDVLVFGHSHIPWDTVATRADGSTLRLLNPGSPTDRRRQPHCTWMSATAVGGALSDVVLHRLPPRG